MSDAAAKEEKLGHAVSFLNNHLGRIGFHYPPANPDQPWAPSQDSLLEAPPAEVREPVMKALASAARFIERAFDDRPRVETTKDEDNPKRPFLIIAGNLAEAEAFCQREGFTGREARYVSRPEMLQGVNGRRVILTGRYLERTDWPRLRDALCNSLGLSIESDILGPYGLYTLDFILSGASNDVPRGGARDLGA